MVQLTAPNDQGGKHCKKNRRMDLVLHKSWPTPENRCHDRCQYQYAQDLQEPTMANC